MRLLLLALLLAPSLAGCLDADAPETIDPVDDPVLPIVEGVTVRLLNGTGTTSALEALTASVGTYYSIGATTFEPTIGATSTGGLFMTSYRGLGAGTAIRRSTDGGQTWDDATPTLPTGTKAVPNSNDPFLYVDPWTDRVYDFDMCLILSGFCVSYSDDDGDTWTTQSVATGEAPALDHQSMAAAPAGEQQTVEYPNVLVFCVNRGSGAVGSWCSSSFDGGIAWTPLVPGYPVGTTQCSGLSGHVTGGADGRFYRGNPSCGGPAVYRSEDGGLTWTEHTIPTDVGVMGHEIATAVDGQGNVHAFWIGDDGMPYLASSADHGDTWGPVHQVAAPGVTAAGFPTVAAGETGVVVAYIATDVEGGYGGQADGMEWTGYLGVVLEPLGAAPALASVPVNARDDPLDSGRPCGAMRCGGFGDFIDVAVDADGRPWVAMAHNGHDEAGIVGTLAAGPSLHGTGPLPELPLGGAGLWG